MPLIIHNYPHIPQNRRLKTGSYVLFTRGISFKERGGGQKFSTSFWMWFSQAPLCRYRFKFIFDDIIFLLSGNIKEYICFWRFNSIIMTWNKWPVFTKSVIMGLNNIHVSPWPLPAWLCMFTVCIYMTLFNTLARHAIRWCSGMSLASHGEGPWFETHTILCSISYFYCYHCFVLFALFCTQWLIYPFSFHIDISLNCIYFILHGIYQNNDNIGLKNKHLVLI